MATSRRPVRMSSVTEKPVAQPGATRLPVSEKKPAPTASGRMTPAVVHEAGQHARNVAADPAIGVAVTGGSGGEAGQVVTARRAGGLRDLSLEVDPEQVGLKAALQHLAKAINVAFQSDFGENALESVYQAAIVRKDELRIVHKDYFGFGDHWLGQFGMLLKSLRLTLLGPDPASPEGKERLREHGPATIRGLLSLIGRKLDIVAEFEDRVPAYVEQMLDRLEASGIVHGWDRSDWEVATTKVGLNIIIRPAKLSDDQKTHPK